LKEKTKLSRSKPKQSPIIDMSAHLKILILKRTMGLREHQTVIIIKIFMKMAKTVIKLQIPLKPIIGTIVFLSSRKSE
jgi:hypothetical protein